MNSYLGGAIDDFSKDDAKIPYVATVELSGTHKDGYVLSLFILAVEFENKFSCLWWKNIIMKVFDLQVWFHDATSVY